MNKTNEVQGEKRRGCLGCLGRGVIVLLAFVVVAIIVGAIYQSVASANDVKKYPPMGQLYDVGEHRLHLYCIGEGSPTVILEAGAGSPGLVWIAVQEKVAGLTRVCSYDRPGYGWSDPGSGPLGSEEVVDILHQLLLKANVPGPYVLVGHSLGGVYIRAYAKQYPSEVLGMVFVDSTHESQNLRFPPAYLDSSKQKTRMYKVCQILSPFGAVRAFRLWNSLLPPSISSTETGAAVLSTMYRNTYCTASVNEDIATVEMLGQPDGPASLGDMPLIVLSAGLSLDEMIAQTPQIAVDLMGRETFSEIVQTMQDLQKELVSLSTQGKQVIAEESTHNIQVDQPELVVDAISEIVEKVREK